MTAAAVDHSLVLLAQSGDQTARCALAEQVRPLVQRYAARFLRDPVRAEDLAQTALMKAFARVGDVRSPEAFHAWLLRITRNECLNELARHRHPQVALSTLEEQGLDIEAPAGGDHDPEEALVRDQLRSLVRLVITTLPEHYRRTLTMRALEDRSYEEISEALGVPAAVARLWYCRARKRFRQAFVNAVIARRDLPSACQAMAGDIAELIEGTLVRTRREQIQGHLGDCHVCRQTEEELRATAFRTPARAWLLGLGLGAARWPQRAARVAHGVARVARTTRGLARVATVTVGGAAVVASAVLPATLVLADRGGVPGSVVAAAGAHGVQRDAAALTAGRNATGSEAGSGGGAGGATAGGPVGVAGTGPGPATLGSVIATVAGIVALDVGRLGPGGGAVTSVAGGTVHTASAAVVLAPVVQATSASSGPALVPGPRRAAAAATAAPPVAGARLQTPVSPPGGLDALPGSWSLASGAPLPSVLP